MILKGLYARCWSHLAAVSRDFGYVKVRLVMVEVFGLVGSGKQLG